MSTQQMPVQVYLDPDFDLYFEGGDNRRLAEDAWLRAAGIAVGLILTDHEAPELGAMMRTMCHDDVFGSWEDQHAGPDDSWISWYVDKSEIFGTDKCRAPGLHVIDLRDKKIPNRR